MDDNKLLPKLSQNLLEILNDEEYYDVTIEVGNDPYVKVFRAHMKNDGTLSHIKLPNILPEIFQIILRYIYGGKLSLRDYDTSDVIKTLIAASELNLQELVTCLQFFFIENKANWIEQNFDSVYQTSFKNDSFLDLQKYCTDLITKEPDKIFKSPNFSSVSEKLLISIIQNDNLQISEIQIWEQVLRWGLAQNQERFPDDIKDYSKDDFNILKNTLQQCIPFIRFYNLTSKEFLDKVFPYGEILPEELITDLLTTFLSLSDPNSKPIKKSNLWIDKLDITDKLTSLYEFKLLFRGSRDGLTRGKFHEICNNHSRTVTIIKVKDSNEILGGYNPIEWKSDGKYGITKDSFILSFNNNKIEDYTLSRVMDERYAILNSSYVGPSFGGTDLAILSYTYGNICRKNFYEYPIRKTERFSVEECEVFQIV
ncbi:hypothetical protein RirG_140950 [Rhizophagus irregularis DAOM 197198w]|uniref:TLDc domain-containing protein n=1 Tax=Rhizophagus irregularis (strain DAOM 197198w) TaxID=1432141 RepID=A0A015KX70_RHIIW|nr:hypothetical protein RirG_140950 [Rhizophagus irregularis DAOM 197198w]